ncbi:hypothetical protein [Micromonospora siamensis]|uniref:Uncharacterized protein n=1 Tax=Micromonospora siamensis TaxID=299152 RepID=A0A1C5HJU9_9ACTN|nr:hypothetical protein [Micromonospora siamensis]SCG46203.1 hypothetical protein GA0074704_1852 [Micromonospora siamensis]
MIRPMLRRAGLVAAAVLTTTLALAAPAAAHGGDAPDGTDYRTLVHFQDPSVTGLTVRAVEAGARLELVNDGDLDVVVPGYSGEPYLRVGPGGVYENRRSPATYLNRTIAGDTKLPPEADPAAPPDWRKIDDGTSVRWHDQRALAGDDRPPPAAAADPTSEHLVRNFAFGVSRGDTALTVVGGVYWVPPPDPYPWWVAATLGFLVLGAAGLLPAARPVGVRGLRAVGALLALGGAGLVVLVVGRALDAGAQTLGGVLAGLLTDQIWSLVTGLGAIAAGVFAVARRPAADFALALAGACLAIFGGFANAAVLSRPVLATAWPPTLARVLVVLALATGAGALGAGILRLRAAARTAAPPRAPVRDVGQPAG